MHTSFKGESESFQITHASWGMITKQKVFCMHQALKLQMYVGLLGKSLRIKSAAKNKGLFALSDAHSEG